MRSLYSLSKRANEPAQFVFDFNPWLQSIGSTAASFSVSDSPDLLESFTTVNQVVVLTLTGGVEGKLYRIAVSCVAANGLIRSSALDVSVIGVRAASGPGDGGGGAVNVEDSLASSSIVNAPSVNAVKTGTVLVSQKGIALGVATLDAAGKVPLAQLPALGAPEFLGEVASEAAMLALPTAPAGSFCTRTDLGTTFQLINSNTADINSWRQLAYPSSPVTSVAGKNGVVVLTAADVGLPLVNNTTDADKQISTATAAALAGKAPVSHLHDIANVTGLAATLDLKSDTSHIHVIANVTGLQTTLDAKAPSTHAHAISAITGLQTTLDAKANSTDVSTQLSTFQTQQADALEATQLNLQGQINTKYDNTALASQTVAEAGLANDKLLTPLRGTQLFNALKGGTSAATGFGLADGGSTAILPSTTGNQLTTLGSSTSSLSISASTEIFNAGVGSGATEPWTGNQRTRLTRTLATVGANTQIKLQWYTKFAFPAVEATHGGFEASFSYSVQDAITGGRGFFGFCDNANPPAAGIEISAGTVNKIGFGNDSTDANYHIFLGNSKFNLGTGFPVGIGNANPIIVERFAVIPGANRRIEWKIRHAITGVTAADVITSASIPAFTSDLAFVQCRDSGANATVQAAFEFRPYATGWFRAAVLGTSTQDVGVSRQITANTTFQASDVNVTNRVNTAAAVTLTIPLDSVLLLGGGKMNLTSFIKGTAVPTIVPATGVTLSGTAPSGLVQGDILVLTHTGDANTWAYV